MSDDSTTIPVELVPASTVMAMERAAVDNQVATAKAHPRKLHLFKKNAMDMVSNDPETAESCHYVRPVGKKLVNGKWVDEFAEGPSIRAAEIVAACYQNLRVKAYIVEQTERFVRCEAQAWDMENNYASSIQAVAATVKKSGEPYSENQRTVVAKALLAKVYRDAIFKVVPRALFKSVMEEAKRVAQGAVKSLEERISRAKAWVSEMKIADAETRVLSRLGVQQWNQLGHKEIDLLRGLVQGIKDDELSYEEAFPHVTHGAAPAGNPPPAEKPKPAPAAPPPPTARASTPKPSPKKEAPAAPEPAPEPKPEPEPAPEPAPDPAPAGQPEEAPSAAPEATNDTASAPSAPDPEATTPELILSDLNRMMRADGINEAKLVAYLRSIKIMRVSQSKLNDLSTIKLNDVRMSWARILPELRRKA